MKNTFLIKKKKIKTCQLIQLEKLNLHLEELPKFF
jgi:hypothetical protein